MKHLVQIVIAVLLSCVMMSGTPKVKTDVGNETIEGFIKSLPNRLDVEYKVSIDTQTMSEGHKDNRPHKTPLIVITPYKNGLRDGTQFTLFPIYPMIENTTLIDNRSIRIYEMRKFRNDSLTGSLLYFDHNGNLQTLILDIKKNTDYLSDQYLEYGDTNAVIYQGYFFVYGKNGYNFDDNWAIFTEDNPGRDHRNVSVGYRHNRSDTIDYTKIRCLIYRGDPDSDFWLGED